MTEIDRSIFRDDLNLITVRKISPFFDLDDLMGSIGEADNRLVESVVEVYDLSIAPGDKRKAEHNRKCQEQHG